jgi:hypothetical protein
MKSMLIIGGHGAGWVRELLLADTQVLVIERTWDEIATPAPVLKVIEAQHDPHEPKPGTHGDVTGIYQRRRGKKHA